MEKNGNNGKKWKKMEKMEKLVKMEKNKIVQKLIKATIIKIKRKK